jgi:nucleoside phosphorylase
MPWIKDYNLVDLSRLRGEALQEDLELLLDQKLIVEFKAEKVVLQGEGALPGVFADEAPRSALHLLLHLHGVDPRWPAASPKVQKPKVVLHCTTKMEYEQLEAALRGVCARKLPRQADTEFPCWETDFAILHAMRPRWMGMVDSALMATQAIEKLDPDAMFMVGIVAGRDDGHRRLGDLLVAASSHDLFYGKWNDGEGDVLNLRVEHRQAMPKVEDRLLTRLESESESETLRQEVFQNTPTARLADAPKIEVGAIVCVPAVIDSKRLLDKFDAQNVTPRSWIGLEMEIFGFYRAIALRGEWKGKSLAIKAISDFAFNKKAASLREYAAYVSAAFVLALLRDGWFGTLR